MIKKNNPHIMRKKNKNQEREEGKNKKAEISTDYPKRGFEFFEL
jgi:hypothetical protein